MCGDTSPHPIRVTGSVVSSLSGVWGGAWVENDFSMAVSERLILYSF